MPLSEHEQRMLDQIESALYAEDPKFASSVRGGNLRAPSTRRRLQGVGLFVLGLAMLVAVLGRHAGVKLSSFDVFVTIAGGIRIDEPAADLAVALAIASAQRDTPFPAGAAVFGEISLTGSLRSCSQSERRIAEARRAGFDHVVVPSADARRAGGGVAGVADLRGAFAATLGDATRSASGATNDEWGV